jgi:GR25 family glycosyltransferase involved in LPS biosynthesis
MRQEILFLKLTFFKNKLNKKVLNDSEILVINLKRDQERLSFISKQLKTFTRIDAVDGKTDDNLNVSFLCKNLCTDTMIGCMKSHIKCWQYIVDKNLNYGVILEDDVQLVPNFKNEYEKVLNSANNSDWDIILLGCFMCKYKDNDLITKALMTLRNPLDYEEDINDLLYKPTTWGGTHAYVVSNNAAKKLLKLFPKAKYHVDFLVSYSGLNILACKKLLAWQTTNFESHNASDYPILNYLLPKIDHKTLNPDFILTMPLCQIGYYKIHTLNIIIFLCSIFILYKITKWRI